jgi:20S proteasome alpha/beta subunit
MLLIVLFFFFCVVAANGVVIATEKKLPSILVDESSVSKLNMIFFIFIIFFS